MLVGRKLGWIMLIGLGAVSMLLACEFETPKENGATSEVPPSPRPRATGSASPIEARHSQGDGVRAAKTQRKITLGTLPVAEAKWEAPAGLTFRRLRTEYDQLAHHGAFSSDELPKLNGAAVELSGAVMPIDKPPEDGKMARFWLASPKVVMAGCVFCNPPTLGDLVYVEAKDKPLVVDREELYRGVVVVRVLGRFFVENKRTPEGIEYLFRLDMREVRE